MSQLTILLRFLDPSFFDTRLGYPDMYYRKDKLAQPKMQTFLFH